MKKPKSPEIKVVVTDEIIRDSVSRNSSHCMIAEAIKLSYPEGTSVSVDLQTIRVSCPKKRQRYTYLTPRIAQVALIKFDQGMMPEPFEVRLRKGQVTGMNPRKAATERARAGKVLTERQSLANAGNLEKAKRSNPLLRQASLRSPGDKGLVPDRIGGKTPPMQKTGDGVVFSQRRAFGLRGMSI